MYIFVNKWQISIVMKTITISDATHEDVKKYCQKQGISMAEFVKVAHEYFQKSAINPSDPPQSVKEELTKIEKRVSQSIAFQKTFERDKLNPLLSDLAEAIVLVKKSGNAATNEEVGQWITKLFSNIAEKMHKPQTAMLEKMERSTYQTEREILGEVQDIKKQLSDLQQQLEQNNKKGLFGR